MTSRPFDRTPPALRWLVLSLLLIALVSAPFLLFEQQIERLVRDALDMQPGRVTLSFLIAAALALDVALPVPSSLVNTTAGAALGFAGGALVCWLGMTLGCLLGYWIGAAGGAPVGRRILGEAEFERSVRISGEIGAGALIALRAVPILAEASTIAAGAAGFPLGRFLIAISLANLGVAGAFAAIGAYSLAANSFALAFAGALGLPAVAYGLHRGYRRLVETAGSGRAVPGASPRPETAGEPARLDDDGSRAWLQSFTVAYSYPVVFTRGLFAPENGRFAEAVAGAEPAKRHRCIVYIDSGVAEARPDLASAVERYFAAHAGRLRLAAPPQVIPGGEAVKDGFGRIAQIHAELQAWGIDRHSYVVAIGGGATLDAVGFAAATAHRGIRHIRVPTTTLSQNDSGVGVKNAVNLGGVKNYAGTFAPPWAVLNDLDFLAGLPERARIAGIAEAVKVALIRDRDFFFWLEAHADRLRAFEPEAEARMILRSAELHMRQIARGGDPFEAGSARPLDFGHWSAHRLESLTRHQVSHGEAVAIGVALDSRYSVLAGLLAPGLDARIAALLERFGFRTWHPALAGRDGDGRPEILAGIDAFREHLGGELTVTLLAEIGRGVEVHAIDPGLVLQAMDWLAARRAAGC